MYFTYNIVSIEGVQQVDFISLLYIIIYYNYIIICYIYYNVIAIFPQLTPLSCHVIISFCGGNN